MYELFHVCDAVHVILILFFEFSCFSNTLQLLLQNRNSKPVFEINTLAHLVQKNKKKIETQSVYSIMITGLEHAEDSLPYIREKQVFMTHELAHHENTQICMDKFSSMIMTAANDKQKNQLTST